MLLALSSQFVNGTRLLMTPHDFEEQKFARGKIVVEATRHQVRRSWEGRREGRDRSSSPLLCSFRPTMTSFPFQNS